MQSNWIGKSIGAEINFKIDLSDEYIKIFTTRPDTIYGATFIAISTDHFLSKRLSEKNIKIKEFIEKCKTIDSDKNKRGFNTGLFVQHPLISNKKLPIFIANFVLTEYGLGAIFGCPAHDQRDLDFANQYNLEIIPVVKPRNYKDKTFHIKNTAFTENGEVINSENLNGLTTEKAKEKIIEILIKKKKLEIKKQILN